MGVYNPFAELPNSCVLCNSKEKCNLHREYAGRSVGRHKDCPLVEVSVPHGRLIDADALRREMYHKAFETDSNMQKWESGCWIRYRLFERAEEAAPTVLEAEG